MKRKASRTSRERIDPVAQPRRNSWLGSMQDTGRIVGDILSSAEDAVSWETLSEEKRPR